MSEQESLGGVCSSVNKSEVVRSYSNENNASPMFGFHIQSTCSIDIKEFEKMANNEFKASESRDATELAQSTKNELVVTVETGLGEKGCENAPASTEVGKLKFSAKVQPDTSSIDSSIELTSDESCARNDKTSVSNSLLDNVSEFVEKTSPDKVSPNHDLETEHENSCGGDDGSRVVLNTSVDAGDSSMTSDDLQLDEKQTDEKQTDEKQTDERQMDERQTDEKQTDDCAMDIDSDSQSPDEEKPVVDSDLGENGKHFYADASKLATPFMRRDHSSQGMHDKRDMLHVCRKRRDSGHKRPPLLSDPPKVSIRQSPFINRFFNPGNSRPHSGYTEYDDHSSTSGPRFHDDRMWMPYSDMRTPGIFPPALPAPAPSPWYGSPVEPPFSCDMSVPPPGMMFSSGMASHGHLPWDGYLQTFSGVPPPMTPGFVPPGPNVAPTNVFQPPIIPPSYGVPLTPVGMVQYPPCNGMTSGFSGASQFDVSAAMPFSDQSYQEWYDWCKKYSEWAQGYNSNMGTEVTNGSKAVVSMATSKSSDSKSPATVTKPTVVKVPLSKKPRRSVFPIGLIPLPSTTEREVVKVTMSPTKPLLASAVNVETLSSNQRDVATKASSSNRISSPPTTPACSTSWKCLDVSEKNLDSSVTDKTDKTDISLSSKTADTRWLSSFKQDSLSEPEETTLSPKQPTPVDESSSWKQRHSLKSKPSKPSSLSRRQNLVSLAATFNADTPTAGKDTVRDVIA